MDNETPKYANWVPEAGGYVANGKVVSKSPQYNEGGKLKLDVDASLFAPQTSNVQVANSTATNAGITTANTVGSGTDVNANITGAGSLGSLNLNTDNPMESVLSSPATKSPSAGQPITTIEDQINQEYLDAAARNDIQGMINALIAMGNYTGQDYSQEIDRLTLQRQEKIRGTDDQFLASYNTAKTLYDQALRQYNQAVQSGDETAQAEASALLDQAEAQMLQVANEQSAWRDQVGYKDAMNQAKQRDLEQQELLWTYKYMDGVDQITNSMLQLVGSYLNFEYDPYNDPKLAKAQAYTKATMTEHFANTGMYNSSAVAYAITQAIAELVPVYEQMAKDELKDSINMLQSTANYLINLEEAQFNMWKSQIQLQWDANQEKRREFEFAVEKSNARGYVNNEEAAILGVEPGSLSQKAREHIQELQEEIDKEQRKLQQDMALAEYNNNLQIQRMWEQNKINKDYAQYENELKKNYYNYTQSVSNTTNKETNTTYTDEEISLINSLLDEETGDWDAESVRKFLQNDFNSLDEDTATKMVNLLMSSYVYPTIDDYSSQFGDNYKTTTTAWKDAQKFIDNFSSWLKYTDITADGQKDLTQAAWQRLQLGVDAAPSFDTQFTDFWQNDAKLKENAKNEINTKMNGESNKEKLPSSKATYAPVIKGDKQFITKGSVKTSNIIKTGQAYILPEGAEDKPENYIFVVPDPANTGRYYYTTTNTSTGEKKQVYVKLTDVKHASNIGDETSKYVVVNDDGTVSDAKNVKKNTAGMLNVRILSYDPSTGSYYYNKY